MIFLSSFLNPSLSATLLVSVPPICTAVPSLPAEPPEKWVSRVNINVRNASLLGTLTPSFALCIIRLLPLEDSPPYLLYTKAVSIPESGKNHMQYGKNSLNTEDKPSIFKKTNEIIPITTAQQSETEITFKSTNFLFINSPQIN